MLKNGFSLIECLIYCCIMAVVSVIVFQFFNSYYQNILHITQKSQQLMAFHSVKNLLIADIQEASPRISKWDISNVVSIVFTRSQECYGWLLKNENLYRITGEYDFINKIWKHASKALVAQNVKVFKYYAYQEDQLVQSVNITLRLEHLPEYQINSTLINRILV